MIRTAPLISGMRLDAGAKLTKVGRFATLLGAGLFIGTASLSNPVHAQSAVIRERGLQNLPSTTVDARTLALLSQMRRAERALSLSGEQVTALYSERGRPPEQSEQTVFFDSAQGYRCEYHSPNRLAGEVIVSRADGYWHSIPRRHVLMVGPPRPRRIGAQIGSAIRALRSGAAQASITGTDTVAGRAADVVVISASSAPIPTAKLWIDLTTGTQLRTELYDAQGGIRSVSYFTQVTYTPNFAPDTFAPLTAPSGTRVVAQQRPVKMNRLPTDAEAGFHVLAPFNLPQGYAFESASVFHYSARGDRGVTLRYRNSWSLLSLFERAMTPNDLQTSAASPRAGTVVVHRNGMQLIAIGALGNSDLVTVLNSMR